MAAPANGMITGYQATTQQMINDPQGQVLLLEFPSLVQKKDVNHEIPYG